MTAPKNKMQPITIRAIAHPLSPVYSSYLSPNYKDKSIYY